MSINRVIQSGNLTRDAELRRDSEKAYADIFESLVGAIYLDSYQNDTLIRAFILRQLGIEPRRTPTEIEAFDYDTLREFSKGLICLTGCLAGPMQEWLLKDEPEKAEQEDASIIVRVRKHINDKTDVSEYFA